MVGHFYSEKRILPRFSRFNPHVHQLTVQSIDVTSHKNFGIDFFNYCSCRDHVFIKSKESLPSPSVAHNEHWIVNHSRSYICFYPTSFAVCSCLGQFVTCKRRLSWKKTHTLEATESCLVVLDLLLSQLCRLLHRNCLRANQKRRDGLVIFYNKISSFIRR